MAKKKDYGKWSKEELVKEVEVLKQQKTYGLVWEKDKTKEIFDYYLNWDGIKSKETFKEANGKFPVLKEVKNKDVTHEKNGRYNLIIEGDNYHSVAVLNFTHAKAIDVIYIDPPYNTGARNWKYNNDYVEKDDSYRHSKWLNFMEKRLKLAKNLLKKDGVLICAIDENELWRLGCLLEEIFFDYEIDLVTIVHNPKGVQGKNFSHVNDFAFFVIPKGQKVIGDRKLNEDEVYLSNLRNWGSESLRSDARNCFYPIIVKNNEIIGFGDVEDNEFHPKKQTEKKGESYYVYPIDIQGVERKWRYARQSVESIKEFLKVKNQKSKDRIEIEIGKDFGTVKTVWQSAKYDASEYGTKLVNALVPGIHFDFPKSIYTVYDCIYPIISERKNAIILDFFAGSGTTGHAVMLLNKEDTGNRQFILCTNNENGIAEEVCYPRIKAVTKSNEDYPDITNIQTNLKYFRTDFVDSAPTDKNKKKIVDKSTEMICIKENAFEIVKDEGEDYKIFRNPEINLGIIFNSEAIEEFIREAKKIEGNFHVYVFSLDETVPEHEFKVLKDRVTLCAIPEVILHVYRRVFKDV
jgi:adenine-specific DNA-methyltransferase